MELVDPGDDPEGLSRLELVSRYINGYYALDADHKRRFEAAFTRRKLPLPRMPPEPLLRRPIAKGSIDRDTFLSYILLIYTGTAIFYSWIYLAERLVKMDIHLNEKHKLIQTGIALFYVIGEILLIANFSGGE